MRDAGLVGFGRNHRHSSESSAAMRSSTFRPGACTPSSLVIRMRILFAAQIVNLVEAYRPLTNRELAPINRA